MAKIAHPASGFRLAPVTAARKVALRFHRGRAHFGKLVSHRFTSRALVRNATDIMSASLEAVFHFRGKFEVVHKRHYTREWSAAHGSIREKITKKVPSSELVKNVLTARAIGRHRLTRSWLKK